MSQPCEVSIYAWPDEQSPIGTAIAQFENGKCITAPVVIRLNGSYDCIVDRVGVRKFGSPTVLVVTTSEPYYVAEFIKTFTIEDLEVTNLDDDITAGLI